MVQTLKSMANRYNNYMTHLGRKRACKVLLHSSDRMLEDAGFSRELLEKGVDAWPWQASDSSTELEPVRLDTLTLKRAVHELKSYSDQELNDLGISRGTIAESVIKGREGIERQEERKVA